MACKCKCKRPTIIKNKFISTIIGAIGLYLGVGFILPLGYFSVYITSYIHLSQNFVNMHFGYFLGFISNLSKAFSGSIGGLLEKKWGFLITTLFGTIIVFVFNLFYMKVQDIYLCYGLTLFLGIGSGVATSLLTKNLVFFHPDKKGVIVSCFGILLILILMGFTFGGEKIISAKGETLEKGGEVYSPETSKRIYYYFFLGVFAIPVGDIIFFLFAHEYKKEVEITDILQKEDNENNNIENDKNNDAKNTDDSKIEDIYEQKENETKEIKEINDDIEEEKKENLLKIEENQEKQDNDKNNNNEDSNKETKKNEDNKNTKSKIRQILKTCRFWRIALASFFQNLPLSFILSTGRIFGAILGIQGTALQFLSLSQGIAMLFVGPIFGFLSDKKGPLIILKISSFISIIPGILLYFFLEIKYLYLISYIVVAIALTARAVSLEPFIMEIYGIDESVILLGILSGISMVGEGLILVWVFILSFQHKGQKIVDPYKYIFIGGAICGLLSFILFLIENKKKFEYENEKIVLDLLIDDKDKIEEEDLAKNE